MGARRKKIGGGAHAKKLGALLRDLVPPPEPEVDLLNEVLQRELEQRFGSHRDRAEVVALRRGAVRIESPSSCLLDELRSFHRECLLEAFQQALDASSVRRIAFACSPLESRSENDD